MKSYRLSLYTEKCCYTNFTNLIDDVYEYKEIYRDDNNNSTIINPVVLLSPELEFPSDQTEIRSIVESQKLMSDLESTRINSEIKPLIIRYCFS
jgi:hypothetical protein